MILQRLILIFIFLVKREPGQAKMKYMLTTEQWFYWDLMWPWPLDQKNFNAEGHWKAFTWVKYMYEQNMTKGERKYDKTTLYMP